MTSPDIDVPEPSQTGAPEVEIDIASDVVCPWCVIGWKQLERALADTGVAAAVRWHPFELNPDMLVEGEALGDHVARKYGSSAAESRKAQAKLTALGAELGFRFDYFDGMRIVNTFTAHQMLAWAEEQGAKHAVKLALFRAYFSDRRDISDPAILASVAAEAGLDPQASQAAMASGRYADSVRARQREWAGLGVEGVPAMLFNRRHLVVGARGVDTYGAILLYLAGPTTTLGERP